MGQNTQNKLYFSYIYRFIHLLNSLSLLVAMKLISRFLIASAIVTAGALAYAPQSFAQTTEDVEFSGVVPGACSFTNVVNGTLGLDNALDTFDSTAGSGVSGTAYVTCTSAATLSVTNPSKASGPNYTAPTGAGDALNSVVTPSGATTTGTANDDGTTLALVAGDTVLDVDMNANSSGAFPEGSYTFVVTLSVTAP